MINQQYGMVLIAVPTIRASTRDIPILKASAVDLFFPFVKLNFIKLSPNNEYCKYY